MKQVTILCVGLLLVGSHVGSEAWIRTAAAACPEFLSGQSLGTLELSSINEASGLAGSRANSGVLWMHNDSGDSARVFATELDGDHLGIYYLSGTGATDWEDMAIGPGPVAGQSYLYLGDIGDNNAVRSSIQVYRVAEPAVSPGQTPVTTTLYGVETFTLEYPDGPRDAETLLVDPLNGDLYVISKRTSYSRVYRAAYPQSTSGTITMEFKGELPWGWATGGDVAPMGDEIIIRGYSNASLWRRPPGTDLWEAFGESPCSIPLVSEPQGESICFDPGGLGYYTISEGTYPPIHYFERIVTPGDANDDDAVDETDALILATYWGQSGVTWKMGDFNEDGVIGPVDASILAAHWGYEAETTPPVAVPEPSALVLLAVGLAVAGLLPVREITL